MSTYNNLKVIKKNWHKVYYYQGKYKAALRCLHGTRKLLAGKINVSSSTTDRMMEIVTFSVVPKLTALWASTIAGVVGNYRGRIIIGDCSGNFNPFFPTAPIEAIPMLNYYHSEKLDLFFSNICTAKYVIICDDDVFWTDDRPINWAMEQFQKDPKIAVVSFMPRDRISSVLQGKVEQPMGSYCLIIKRDIWLQEKLSFSIVHPDSKLGYDWFYDTADFANIELIKRGYKVVIAPDSIRNHLIPFEGTSSWILRIQSAKGNIGYYIKGSALLKEKAYRTILLSKKISKVIAKIFPDLSNTDLTEADLLKNAERACCKLLSDKEISRIRNDIESKMIKLKAHLLKTYPPSQEQKNRN